MSPDFAYLPPLPPIAVTLRPAMAEAKPPAARWESLMAAATVLLGGFSVLIWTMQLDRTNSHGFVATAAALTVILPRATFTALRATSRRR